MLRKYTTIFIVNEAKWKKVSKNNSSDFLLIEPAVIGGGQISFVFFSPVPPIYS